MKIKNKEENQFLANRFFLIAALYFFSLINSVTAAPCPTTGINPVTDTNWACTFPMQLAGTISFGSSSEDEAADAQNNTPPVCVCSTGNGLYNVY